METTNKTHPRYGRTYSIAILIIALVIIAVGVILRPKPKRETPVSELESAALRRLTQERRLTELGDYIGYAAQNAGRDLVYIPQLEQSAVVIGARSVATALHASAAGTVSAISTENPETQMQLQLQSRRPDVPVLLLNPPPGVSLQAPRAATVDTGDWVLAVALREDGTPVFTYGLYESSANARCGPFSYQRLRASIPLTSAFLGGGLFSLRGELAGIIVKCESEVVVLSLASIQAALKQPIDPNDILQDTFGMRVASSNSGASLDVIGLWKGRAAGEGKLTVGDRILSIDETAVNTAAKLLAGLTPGASHTLTVRRGRRQLDIQITPVKPYEPAAAEALGLVFFDTPDGVVVRSVVDGSVAARAGILPGDIVRRAGPAVAASAGAVADLADQQPSPLRLSLERNGAEFEVQLTRE